jgi:hypothetical protein
MSNHNTDNKLTVDMRENPFAEMGEHHIADHEDCNDVEQVDAPLIPTTTPTMGTRPQYQPFRFSHEEFDRASRRFSQPPPFIGVHQTESVSGKRREGSVAIDMPHLKRPASRVKTRTPPFPASTAGADYHQALSEWKKINNVDRFLEQVSPLCNAKYPNLAVS